MFSELRSQMERYFRILIRKQLIQSERATLCGFEGLLSGVASSL